MQARDKFFSTLLMIRDSVSEHPTAQIGVIDVGERLDARSAERMKSKFKELARQGRSRHIIDMSRVDDLDSGGLATLISTLRAVREAGGSVHLVANSVRVTHILELTALTRLFKVYPSLQAALSSV
jgi:anti-sigma B factor antagonist